MNQSQIARIIAVHKERYHLSSKEHGEFYARLKPANYYQSSNELFPTAGDLVEYSFNPQGDSQILHTLPRKSFFQRYDTLKARNYAQAIAANFDTVLILTSANHDFNSKRLRRYLSMARESGAAYAIVLTKADLTEKIEAYLQGAKEAAMDCPVHVISAAKGWGLDEIRAYLQPESVTVFLGSSGVGKSTLVNALAGKEIMDVNGIRENDSKGRHTTTHRQIVSLENGAMILDTPGMRELGLIDAMDGVEKTFEEITALTHQCRFGNCTHQHEPGCAVKKALEEGRIALSRWEEYQMLAKEARRKQPKTKAEAMQKAARQKAISKYSRQLKKGRKIDESIF